MGSILGAVVKRVEDERFVTGAGTYMQDIGVEGALWMAPVRSAIPHGALLSVDADMALSMPGVVRVYTAGDLDLAPMPIGAPDMEDVTRRPVIAFERVRFVGDIVAVVVAESERAARDGAEAVWADIEPLPVVATPRDGLDDGAPLLFPELGTNVVYDRGDDDDTSLDGADVVVEVELVNRRVAAVPLETNGAIAIPRGDGQIDVWLACQGAHASRRGLSRVLGVDESLIRVRVPDVGGGFGAKIPLYPEQVLVPAIAIDLGRPVRWHETRSENMVAMTHGRAQKTTVRLGATGEGTLTGVQFRVLQDAGAYPLFGAYLPAFTRRMAVGPYLIPKVDFRWRSVLTNTTPVHAYRGAGRPEATMGLERAMDELARALGMDPAALRRRNFIAKDAFPHTTTHGIRYDSGDYEAALESALDAFDYEAARAEQERRRTVGEARMLGIGISSYVEITAGVDRADWGAVSVEPDGTVTITSGGVSQGQGHETTFAQMVAATLRVPLDAIRFVQGDTDAMPRSGGTMGSRSLQVIGSAVHDAATETIDKAMAIFAHDAEAPVDDVIQFDDGRIGVRGVPSSGRTLAELAQVAADPQRLPEGMDPGLGAGVLREQAEPTFPFGTHLTLVEVDTDTGEVRILRHVSCDDAGVILNPLVADGQIHGGIAQGVSQALVEHVRYDGGYPLTGNLASYVVASAPSLPMFGLTRTETPTPENPLGAKGIGEAGTIGATPAVVNAVIDALSPLGIRTLDMPFTPVRVWEAIEAAR